MSFAFSINYPKAVCKTTKVIKNFEHSAFLKLLSYFNFLKKKNELPKQNQQTVLKHFKFIFGSKRLWIWNLKFSKHKAVKYCYDIFKEM